MIKKSNQIIKIFIYFFSINLWSIIKNSVGKDLSKISVPVNFSEPTSMLQRITEEFEYSLVLDIAAKINNNWEQLVYVAAFTISSYIQQQEHELINHLIHYLVKHMNVIEQQMT